ncbi:MAG: DUF4350 domain-containing protein [Nannocystales bacterium]
MVPGLLFSLVLALAPDPSGESAGEVSAQILADPTFAFCHEPEYPLTPYEAQWCPVLKDALESERERCPAFVEACDARRAVLKGEGRLSARAVEDAAETEERAAGGGPGRGHEKRDDKDEDEDDAFELPVLGGLAEILFWLVIGVALVGLVVAIIRNLAQSRALALEPEEAEGSGPDQDPDAARAAAAARAMETDVERLLSLARDSAQRGSFADAVDFSHAALLRRLDHEGLIRLHASRTNGEYVRELRGNASLVDPVRDVLRRVDRAQFGPRGAERSVFDDIHARVLAIVKTVGPLVLLVTTVLGMGIACDTGGERVYPWSTSPSGNQAVMELLRREGVIVTYRTESLTGLGTDDAYLDPTLVMLEDAWVSEEEWQAVRAWVDAGGSLIIAGGEIPPWLQVSYVDTTAQTGADEAAASEAQDTATGQLEAAEAAAEVDAAAEAHGELGLPQGSDASPDGGLDPDLDGALAANAAIDDLVWEELDEPQVVLTSVLPLGRGLLVEQAVIEIGVDGEDNTSFASFAQGRGRIEVFADGRMFTNAALAFELNPGTIVVTMQQFGGTVEFVDGWVGRGADTPADTIKNSHLTAAVVQLLLFILALYLWRGRQFGRGRDPISQGRRAFSRHAVAMGRQYEKARAASFAARLFSGWVLERLRNRFTSAAGAGLLGLSQEVARRSGRDETEVMRLLLAAHGTLESVPAAGGTTEDLALVRDLGRLMREIGETT